jgi:hypothetical protein
LISSSDNLKDTGDQRSNFSLYSRTAWSPRERIVAITPLTISGTLFEFELTPVVEALDFRNLGAIFD